MNKDEFLRMLGLNIKIVRTIKGLSQDDIANKLDIDKSYFSKLERGLANPSIIYLRELSACLGVDIKELVDTDMSAKKMMKLK